MMDRLNRIPFDLSSATGWDLPVILAGLFTFATLLFLWTRLTSGVSTSSSSGTSKPPPSLPYWIPFLAHLPHWIFDYDGTLRETKSVSY
jgi:hypothetical protein